MDDNTRHLRALDDIDCSIRKRMKDRSRANKVSSSTCRRGIKLRRSASEASSLRASRKIIGKFGSGTRKKSKTKSLPSCLRHDRSSISDAKPESIIFSEDGDTLSAKKQESSCYTITNPFAHLCNESMLDMQELDQSIDWQPPRLPDIESNAKTEYQEAKYDPLRLKWPLSLTCKNRAIVVSYTLNRGIKVILKIFAQIKSRRINVLQTNGVAVISFNIDSIAYSIGLNAISSEYIDVTMFCAMQSLGATTRWNYKDKWMILYLIAKYFAISDDEILKLHRYTTDYCFLMNTYHGENACGICGQQSVNFIGRRSPEQTKSSLLLDHFVSANME